MPTLSTKIEFAASHYYRVWDWTDAKNREMFGSCANRHGHGHNYQVEVSLNGPVDPNTGMIINFLDLHPLLQRAIIEPFDHKNLNEEIPFFETHIPTLENIAVHLWDRLLPVVAQEGLDLKKLRVIENENLYVEFDGRFSECSL